MLTLCFIDSILQEESQVRYRELLRLEQIFEEDLRKLKETDIMAPKTRAEFNRRKLIREGADPSRQDRKLKKFNFSKMDQVLFQRKLDQMQALKKNTSKYEEINDYFLKSS